MEKKKIYVRELISSFLSFYRSAEIDLTSVAVAYYLLISLFPIMMTLATILPYLPINSQQILAALEDFFPSRLYPSVSRLVTNLLTQPSNSLLGISIITTLWTISKSMTALQKAVNKAYGVTEHRDFIIGHVVGILLGIGLQIMIFLSVTVLAFGQGVVQLIQNFIPLDNSVIVSLLHQSQSVTYLALFFSLVMLYFFLPNIRVKKIRYALPGALFVVVTIGTVGKFFAWYVESYASKLLDFRLATSVVFLVLILWFVFMANVLIIGAILNATIQSLQVDEFAVRDGDVVSILNRIKGWFTPLD